MFDFCGLKWIFIIEQGKFCFSEGSVNVILQQRQKFMNSFLKMYSLVKLIIVYNYLILRYPDLDGLDICGFQI